MHRGFRGQSGAQEHGAKTKLSRGTQMERSGYAICQGADPAMRSAMS